MKIMRLVLMAGLLATFAVSVHAADNSITGMSAASTITGAEVFPCDQSGTTKKCTLGNGFGFIKPEQSGAVGNGTADDTTAVQTCLTTASNNGATCLLTPGSVYKITAPLYIWGKGHLRSWQTDTQPFGQLNFVAGSNPYLILPGLSAQLVGAEEWSGSIRQVKFNIVSASVIGRIIFPMRSRGALIEGNEATTTTFGYSLTSSGNDNAWFAGTTIRKDIVIRANRITATADGAAPGSSEGIGLADWDGAVIEDNIIEGVGDDPIGVHYSNNITIRNNRLTSADGRIFVSNTRNLIIDGNIHTRCIQGQAGTWIAGTSLLYVGHETTAANALYAPENVIVTNNLLIHPQGSIDNGNGVIQLVGSRQLTATSNTVLNNSSLLVSTAGIFVNTVSFSGTWSDPTGLDVTDVAKVRNHVISGNNMAGAFPLGTVQSGTGANYLGTMIVTNNYGSRHSWYSSNIQVSGNTTGNEYVQAYSASITPDASRSPMEITVTNNSALAINNPTNLSGNTDWARGQIMIITVSNESGGAMGAITWDAVYKFAAATKPAEPANNTQLTIAFWYDATVGVNNRWRELWRNTGNVTAN